ncbi:MAG: DUF6110 family protein [Selenomonas sp.]
MFFCDWKKLGLFAGGVLFGTAGLKILSSDDAQSRASLPRDPCPMRQKKR